jgi:hypothetical protein
MKRNSVVTPEKGMKQYRKIGGGSLRLADGRRIKSNQTFWAYPETLSKSSLMSLEECQGNDISKTEQKAPVKADVKQFTYASKEVEDGFVVVDSNDKVLSEPSTVEKVEEWVLQLNGGKQLKDLNLHPKEEVDDPVVTFHKEKVSPGWFVVKNTEGKQVSEGKMRGKSADTYIAELLEE